MISAPPPGLPGWYLNQNGEKQWWDGKRWSTPPPSHEPALPPPSGPQGIPQRSSKPRPRVTEIIGWTGLGAFAILLTVAILGTLFGGPSGSDPAADTPNVSGPTSDPQEANSAGDSEPEKDKEAEPEKKPEPTYDEQMEEQGYWVVESGSLYIRAMDPDEYSCGYAPCIYYHVATVDGCPNTLYLEASILQGETVVGMANDLVAGVRPREGAALKLEDYTDGDNKSFRINEVNCY